ncbi:MAG: SHOCT domain-containing protein [Candidatus Jorgensenbacteria bacterium]|nr:SHOCT domain-containing protein [Candidatus Jorgensenbacteria bacterium]
MFGNGWYGSDWMVLIMILFWAAVIALIVSIVRGSVSGRERGRKEDSPLEILEKRYVRGEIDKKEFEQKKKDLVD